MSAINLKTEALLNPAKVSMSALRTLFRIGDAWIRKPSDAPLFGGRSALDRMLSGQVADLFVVRRHIDARRGGQLMIPPLSRVEREPCCRMVPSRTLGRELKKINSSCVAHDSGRDPGDGCVALFRTRILTNCIQAQHFCLMWDGTRIINGYEKRMYSAPGV